MIVYVCVEAGLYSITTQSPFCTLFIECLNEFVLFCPASKFQCKFRTCSVRLRHQQEVEVNEQQQRHCSFWFLVMSLYWENLASESQPEVVRVQVITSSLTVHNWFGICVIL